MSCFRLFSALLAFGVLHAQLRVGEWTTVSGDAQRSNWLRRDPKISVDSVRKGGVQFLWKKKLGAAAQPGALTPAILMDRFISHRGFRAYAFLAGAGDVAYGMDSDLGIIEWQTKLRKTVAPRQPMECGGGMSYVARATASAYGNLTGNGPRAGRAGIAKSGVGEPGQGAVTLRQAPEPRPGRPAGPGGRPLRREPVVLYGLSSDGVLHTMYVSNGEEPAPGVPFLPVGAGASGFSVIDGVAYAATRAGCGEAPNGFWGMELASGKISKLLTPAPVAGRNGAAFDDKGTAYLALESGVLQAVARGTMEAKASYNAGSPLITSAVVFTMGGQTYIAAASKDGVVHVVDRAMAPVAKSAPGEAVSSLTIWQDTDGTTRLAGAGSKTVITWTLAAQGGVPAFGPGWTSPEMVTPLAPMIVNGVMWTVSSGASRTAALYALDAATGKELWNSGKTITAQAHSGGLSAGASQLYVQTNDGVLYAFGVPIEH